MGCLPGTILVRTLVSEEEEEGSDSDCGTYPQLYAGKEKRRRLAERDRRRSLPVKPHVWPAVPEPEPLP